MHVLTQLLWQLHHGNTYALIVPVKHWVAMQNVKWKYLRMIKPRDLREWPWHSIGGKIWYNIPSQSHKYILSLGHCKTEASSALPLQFFFFFYQFNTLFIPSSEHVRSAPQRHRQGRPVHLFL